VLFGLTRGEIALIAFIFALVYSAGLLPKLAARLAGGGKDAPPPKPDASGRDEA
jgi:hypothetical protein